MDITPILMDQSIKALAQSVDDFNRVIAEVSRIAARFFDSASDAMYQERLNRKLQATRRYRRMMARINGQDPYQFK